MSVRWASRRRDLLFALAGGLIASAVLIPIWEVRVCAERERAEAFEDVLRERERQLQRAREQERAAREIADARAKLAAEQMNLALQAALREAEAIRAAEMTQTEDKP